MSEEIDRNFPMSKYRPGQRECIEAVWKALEKNRFVMVEAPTGSGKSAVAYTISQMVKSSYYITPQKFLQDQLIGDFGDNGKHLKNNITMVDLKGRSEYPCNYYQRIIEDQDEDLSNEEMRRYSSLAREKIMCDRGQCKKKNKSRLEYCGGFCPYYLRVDQALASRICLMNFYSFIFQTNVINRFGVRDLLIIDECFHPHTRIMTNHGMVPIGNIVNRRLKYKVLSYNQQTKELEFKPIVRWLRREKQLTYKVLAGNRVLYPTIDHKIYTTHGTKKLSELKIGDRVLVYQNLITELQKQLVLGSLLGDANVQLVKSGRKSQKFVNKGDRARIRFQHGPKQFKYLDWKYKYLREHVNTKPRTIQSKGYTKTIRKFSTKCTFYESTQSVFVNNKKSLNLEWLKQIKDFGLAIWFMDDGSLSNDVAHFHTEGYSFHENCTIRDWLLSQGFPARILKYKKRDHLLYYISIGRDGARKLANRIAKFIPNFMRYKLPKGNWEAYITPPINRPILVSEAPILKIEPYKTEYTYDLEVADNHNYIAGSTIVSNCHNIEDMLMGFIEISICDRSMFNYGVVIPELKTVEEYINYFEEVDIYSKIKELINVARIEGDFVNEELWMSNLMRLNILKKSNPDIWIIEYITNKDSTHTLKLKPLFINHFTEKLLFSYANKVLMMSATLLSKGVMCRSLGIHPDTCRYIALGSSFPVEVRPVKVVPVGSMTFKNKAETMPKLLKKVEELCKKHKDERGIIHTHTMEIASYIYNNSSTALRYRLVFQVNFANKKEMVRVHGENSDSIIIAPAMHEGLDLKDDLGRFQIICKVPYPSKGDAQIAARMEVDPEFYDWKTSLKLLQSYGRIHRHEDDHGVTYILDSEFERFYNRTKNLFPSWFSDAVEI